MWWDVDVTANSGREAGQVSSAVQTSERERELT